MAELRAIREITFSGSHYDRGAQRGRRLRETLIVPELPSPDPAFVRGCFESAAGAFPPAIDEFEGIVRGGGFDRDRMTAYYFARIEGLLGCTMVAVTPDRRDAGRGPLVGRNYDWATADLRWCELQRFAAGGGPRRIGYTHHWAGCADVLNEGGLFVAIASLPPVEVRLPGMQWNIVVDMISETCDTVRDAARACARVQHLRPMSYLLADARGDVAVVEATPNEVRVRRPEHGLVVAANAPQGGETVASARPSAAAAGRVEAVLPQPPNYRSDALARAQARIERARALLSAAVPRISPQEVRRVLADHEASICAGDHSRDDGDPWGTIWSSLCEPAQGQLSIAPGLPCRHEYRTFRIGP
jgi:hypothetical protein